MAEKNTGCAIFVLLLDAYDRGQQIRGLGLTGNWFRNCANGSPVWSWALW